MGFILPFFFTFLASSPLWATSHIPLTFRIKEEPQGLDWHRTQSPMEKTWIHSLMEGLVSLKPGSGGKPQAVPQLATRWTVSQDKKVYTYFLKHPVRWSDGVELKAAHFVFSWKRLLAPLTADAAASLLFQIQGAESFHQGKKDFSQVGIQALDDYTLQVRLIRPSKNWNFVLAFAATFPMRQDIIERYGNTGWDSPGKMVTLGPYLFVRHDENRQWVFRRNLRYHGKPPASDEWIARVIPDDSEALQLYQAGQIDLLMNASFPEAAHAPVSEKKQWGVWSTRFLGFNTQQYPLSEPHFRRAIAFALNLKKLSWVLKKGKIVATSCVPPGLLGYSLKLGLGFDPARAQEELRLSGIALSQSNALDYLLPEGDLAQHIGQWIQAELKKYLNLSVRLNKVQNQTYRTQMSLKSFPLFDLFWTPAEDLSAFFNHEAPYFARDPQWDRFFILDQEARKKIEAESIQTQKALLEKALLIPLYYESNDLLAHHWVKNFQVNLLQQIEIKKLFILQSEKRQKRAL